MKLSSKKFLFIALFFSLTSITFAILKLRFTAFADCILAGIAFTGYLITDDE